MSRRLTFQEKKTIAIDVLNDIREDYNDVYKQAREMGGELITGDYVQKKNLKIIKSIDQTVELLSEQ